MMGGISSSFRYFFCASKKYSQILRWITDFQCFSRKTSPEELRIKKECNMVQSVGWNRQENGKKCSQEERRRRRKFNVVFYYCAMRTLTALAARRTSKTSKIQRCVLLLCNAHSDCAGCEKNFEDVENSTLCFTTVQCALWLRITQYAAATGGATTIVIYIFRIFFQTILSLFFAANFVSHWFHRDPLNILSLFSLFCKNDFFLLSGGNCLLSLRSAEKVCLRQFLIVNSLLSITYTGVLE